MIAISIFGNVIEHHLKQAPTEEVYIYTHKMLCKMVVLSKDISFPFTKNLKSENMNSN